MPCNFCLKESPYPREDFLIALLSERTNKEVKDIKDIYEKSMHSITYNKT